METIKWVILKKDLSDGKRTYSIVSGIPTRRKMKKTKNDKIGCIYQIDPEKDEYGLPGQFIVATEIHDWGIQGYLLLAYPDQGNLVRFKGRAYLRPTWDEIFRVGKVEWEKKDDDEPNTK